MSTKTETTMRALRRLAVAYGIQPSYQNILDGRRRRASAEVLVSVLGSLGAPLTCAEESGHALRERRQQIYLRGPEPVAVAWDGRGAAVRLHLPIKKSLRTWRCCLKLETGEERVWEITPGRKRSSVDAKRIRVEGNYYWDIDLALPRSLPIGYHVLTVESGRDAYHTLMISAPKKAFVETGGERQEGLGCVHPCLCTTVRF